MEKGTELRRIDIKLPKSLVDDFEKISKAKGYQRMGDAFHDVIAWHVEKEKLN
jgi:metal-responsive CopG/Arc/MetJ family transcriptional regulator